MARVKRAVNAKKNHKKVRRKKHVYDCYSK